MPLKKFKEVPRDEKKRLSLTLIVTDECNLNCSYCYENCKERKKGKMDLAVAKEAITYYMEREDVHKDVAIDFFGGEPLLAFPLIKEIVEWFLSRFWKKNAYFSLVTNGTVMTEEIKTWLSKYSYILIVAFTIDGCKKAHDINRCNSYESVLLNIPFFKKYWPYQPTKFTINDKTIQYIAESVMYLEQLEIDFNGGIVLENIWGDAEQKKRLLKMYERQLAILVDFYEKKPDLYPPAPLFPVFPEYLGVSANEVDQLKKDNSRFCGAGHEMVTIDVDGTTHACHRFLPICTRKQTADKPVNRQSHWEPVSCARCKLILSCPTCAGLNYQINGDTGIRTTFHCEAFKLGMQATCHLEALRLKKIKSSQFKQLPGPEQDEYRHRLDVVIDIMENEI